MSKKGGGVGMKRLTGRMRRRRERSRAGERTRRGMRGMRSTREAGGAQSPMRKTGMAAGGGARRPARVGIQGRSRTTMRGRDLGTLERSRAGAIPGRKEQGQGVGSRRDARGRGGMHSNGKHRYVLAQSWVWAVELVQWRKQSGITVCSLILALVFLS